MKKWILIFSVVLILVLISTGCASSAGTARPYPVTTTAAATRTAVPSTTAPPMLAPAQPPIAGKSGISAAPSITVNSAGGPSYGSSTSASQSTTTDALAADRMVIRTGNIQLVVKEISTSLDNIVKIAADNGGYVVSSQRWKDNQRNFGSISIRVLAANYDKTVAALRSLAISVTSETSSSQDVTQEYTDLNSRLTNLQATEAQLLKIMATATKVEDVLAVQAQLTNVRGEIEQTKGRMLYLERTTSTSLITIQLNESVFGLKFSADKVRVDTNEKVTFIPEVTGGFAPFNYQWDFGDGEKSTEVSASHIYKVGGNYTVVLSVTDDKGYNNQAVRADYINVQSTWNAGSVAGSAWNAVQVFAKVAANVVIWIVTFAPVWIVIGAIVWLCLYLNRRKARKAAEKKIQAQDKAK
jgi:PKD repeat protein